MPPRRRGAGHQATAAEFSSDFRDEPELAGLSQAQKNLLDFAFDNAEIHKSARKPAKKRRRVDETEGSMSPPASTTTMTAADPAGEEGGGFLFPGEDADMGGGFIVNDENDGEEGGFIVDDFTGGKGAFMPDEDISMIDPVTERDFAMVPIDKNTLPPRTHLPLSLIPAALSLAKLPPSDSQALEVFKQAAEGWEEPESAVQGPVYSLEDDDGRRGSKEKGVSRKDFFAVCAILMEGRKEEIGTMQEKTVIEASEDEEQEEEQDQDDSDDESEFEFADDLDDEEDDDDDGGFIRTPGSRKKAIRVNDADDSEAVGVGGDDDDLSNPNRRRRRRVATRSTAISPPASLPSSPTSTSGGDGRSRNKAKKAAVLRQSRQDVYEGDDDEEELVLSRKERRAARDTFDLFLGPEGVKQGKEVIGFKEVKKAVLLLKEPLGVEDVKEMISIFSSAPDKASLTLADFERLMWEGGFFG